MPNHQNSNPDMNIITTLRPSCAKKLQINVDINVFRLYLSCKKKSGSLSNLLDRVYLNYIPIIIIIKLEKIPSNAHAENVANEFGLK